MNIMFIGSSKGAASVVDSIKVKLIAKMEQVAIKLDCEAKAIADLKVSIYLYIASKPLIKFCKLITDWELERWRHHENILYWSVSSAAGHRRNRPECKESTPNSKHCKYFSLFSQHLVSISIDPVSSWR